MNPTTLTQKSDNSATETPKGTLWSVGTLTYTTKGLVILFCWLLWGDFAWALHERSVPTIITILFKKFEASDMVIGLLIGSLPPALSMIISPIISYKSDRHRGRWGRRIPFLLAPVPLIVFSMIGLASSPRFGTFLNHFLASHSPGLNTYTLVFLGLFWTLYVLACITFNSVFGGLVNDVVPQPVLGRFFAMFRTGSLLAAIIFNYWMLAKAEIYYVGFFLVIAAIYGVCFTIMCLKVKEGNYPPPPQPVAISGVARGFLPAAKSYFTDCFGKSYYLWFFGMMATASVANGPVNIFSLFYAKSINMSMESYGKCLALTYVISLVLAYPIGSLADRFHPLRVSVVASALYAVFTLWGGLYARDSATFAIAFIAHGVLAGSQGTAVLSMGQKLLPRSRFAELMSANGIITSLSSVAIAPVVGYVLDHTGHTYHYTFYAAAGLAMLAVAINLVMQRKFASLGGWNNYVAPE